MIGPAMTRPMPPPTAVRAAMIPTPVGTLATGNSSRMMPKDSGRTPPPIPWMARPTMRTPIEWARPATSRAGRQRGQRGDQHALLPHHVADAAHDGREDRRGQQVHGHDPGDRVLRGVERVLDGGQGRDHERLQQRVGGHPEEEGDEGEPVARSFEWSRHPGSPPCVGRDRPDVARRSDFNPQGRRPRVVPALGPPPIVGVPGCRGQAGSRAWHAAPVVPVAPVVPGTRAAPAAHGRHRRHTGGTGGTRAAPQTTTRRPPCPSVSCRRRGSSRSAAGVGGPKGPVATCRSCPPWDSPPESWSAGPAPPDPPPRRRRRRRPGARADRSRG